MTYRDHLSKDKKLVALLEANEQLELRKRKNIHSYLCASITSQQLSTKVADIIYKRFLALYGGKEPSPEQIMETSVETFRSIGFSNSKAQYVRNVAEFALEHGMEAKMLSKLDDEAVINYLTRIKGVGRWTVEMLLMFALGRADVFALDDLGVQQAMTQLYKLKAEDKKKLRADMIRISNKWKPYRSYACMLLWRWKDNKPDPTAAP